MGKGDGRHLMKQRRAHLSMVSSCQAVFWWTTQSWVLCLLSPSSNRRAQVSSLLSQYNNHSRDSYACSNPILVLLAHQQTCFPASFTVWCDVYPCLGQQRAGWWQGKPLCIPWWSFLPFCWMNQDDFSHKWNNRGIHNMEGAWAPKASTGKDPNWLAEIPIFDCQRSKK